MRVRAASCVPFLWDHVVFMFTHATHPILRFLCCYFHGCRDLPSHNADFMTDNEHGRYVRTYSTTKWIDPLSPMAYPSQNETLCNNCTIYSLCSGPNKCRDREEHIHIGFMTPQKTRLPENWFQRGVAQGGIEPTWMPHPTNPPLPLPGSSIFATTHGASAHTKAMPTIKLDF